MAAGAVVVAGCGIGLGMGGKAEATCADGVRTLRVAVTPELARIVTEVAGTVDGGRDGACTKTVVTAQSSSDVAASVRTTGRSPHAERPDVWIPDSSAWLRRSAVGAVSLSSPYQSVARSPIVVAVARQTAASLGWNGRTGELGPLLGRGPAGRPVDIYLRTHRTRLRRLALC